MKIDNTKEREIIPMDMSGLSVFVVTAYRWGKRDSHSYVVGVYGDVKDALAFADNEESFRSNKYVCEIVEMIINSSIWEKGCKTIKRVNNVQNIGEICE